MSTKSRLIGVAFLLAFISGFSALTHELLWTRRMIDLLGASAESSDRVFGCFFLGLGVGAAFAARWIHRVAKPWLAVALAEFGIAIFTLPMLFLPQWTDWIWPTLGLEKLVGWPGIAIKTLLSALILLPPSFCMGLVLPFLGHGLLRWTHRLGTDGVRLYAVNTLGGAIGLLATIMCLLPSLGAIISMTTALVLNLVSAAGALFLNWKFAAPSITSSEGTTVSASKPLPRVLLAVAFFSALGILAAEVIANVMLMLVATLSFYAPAAILFTIILSLALSAFLAPRLRGRFSQYSHVSLITGTMTLAGIAFVLGPMIFMGIVEHVNVLEVNGSVNEFIIKLALLAFLSLGPGFLLAGFVFPLTISWAADAVGDTDGKKFGWLLAVNGLGGVAGAEMAYRVLLPVFDVHVALGVVAVSYAVVALMLSWRDYRRRLWMLPRMGIAIAVMVITFSELPKLPLVNTHHQLSVLDHRSGRDGSVAVVENNTIGRCILVDNQYLLGGSHALVNEERQANLPLLLHPAPRDIAFIGLATGITPGAALLHSNLNSITVVELSPLVRQEATHFFGEFNHDITRSKRARVVIDDGRTVIAAAPDCFDVVIGDLFLPWAPGEGRLYSVEHFRDVRRSLRPGGVFCQWLAMYQFTPRQFEIIADTFQKVFPHTYLFCNALDSESPTLALIGLRDDQELNWQTIAARCAALQKNNSLNRDALLRNPQSLAQLYLGEWRSPINKKSVAINTLGNLLIELDAGRERLSGDPGRKYFFGSRWLEFCHERREIMIADGWSTDSPLNVAMLQLADRRMQKMYFQVRESLPGPPARQSLLPPPHRDRQQNLAARPH